MGSEHYEQNEKLFACAKTLGITTFSTPFDESAVIALGGAGVEKHFTLSRADGGPDAAMEPHEFKRSVSDCRNAWRSIDRSGQLPSSRQRKRTLAVPTLSVHAPERLMKAIGHRAVRNISIGEPLSWEMFD